jgi:exonuclease VII small subunit
MASIATSVIGQATGVLTGLLAQHTVRMKDAENENAAAAEAIPNYDADLQQINQAYNAGTASAAQCVAALNQVAAQVEAYLKEQVGKPGTSWVENSTACNKQCTVGCCLFFLDMLPGIKMCVAAINSGGGTVNVPTVFGDKYGLSGRPGYALQFVKPSAASSIAESVLGSASPLAANTAALPGATTSSKTLLLVIVIAALAVGLTVAWGRT